MVLREDSVHVDTGAVEALLVRRKAVAPHQGPTPTVEDLRRLDDVAFDPPGHRDNLADHSSPVPLQGCVDDDID